ncbi:Poly [ADP-ribose] polymerase 1 [Dichanthelium oligosanthes]|uniref:Poly [ADP-ribose] polymerase n=1 Tax=Dichanthelium oligosanthes TaxID=888268 RepID=A0A1E5V675_9POAL|nr:Poly [ADP-ribose] polymerase 1 [Dichanthelium oligosanthes]
MAAPPKAWKAEYAKSGRASCKSCRSPIAKDQLRLGKMVQATQFDGFMPMWNHASCIFGKKNQIKSADDVEGIDALRWDDQEKIRNYVGSASAATSSTAAVPDKCTIEVAPSARTSCRRCSEKITKGTVRVSAKLEGQASKGIPWYHVNCFFEVSPSATVEKFSGWDTLSDEDKRTVLDLVKKYVGHNEPPKGSKRKKGENDMQSCKAAKLDGNTSEGIVQHKGKLVDTCDSNASSADIQQKLKEQSDTLWKLKDELKKHVSAAELRDMLEANEQDTSGPERHLLDCCADGMLFGALGPCPVCTNSLYYYNGQYQCGGNVSEWSKCTYSTTEPVRIKKKWQIPVGIKNDYLTKWFKSQKVKKPERVLPPMSPEKSGSKATQRAWLLSSEGLDKLRFCIVGQSKEVVVLCNCVDLTQNKAFVSFPKESMPTNCLSMSCISGSSTHISMILLQVLDEWIQKLKHAGANFHARVAKDIDCLISCGELDNENAEVRKARRLKIPVVREDYIGECISKNRVLPFDLYKVEDALESSKGGTVTVKVKGQSAVHESSGLQDTAHILEDGKSIYNTTLNMSDLARGVNRQGPSQYFLLGFRTHFCWVIEEDDGSECYVFRKWGRVGNEQIGGKKVEEMSKTDAIHEFKRLFLEKTGNPWEAWEQKTNFKKQPGRFYPLDIDYGVKQAPKRKDISEMKSSLAPRLLELMKMLFNVETYRAAMMEFEINMSEMPLGKLSKENIQKGFEALTEIQNLLRNTADQALAVRESLIVAASNRFFTLIPSIHPHIIRDEDDLMIKAKMLEALQDIEIASKLVGFDSDNDESLDDKYMKLHCNITPLPHDSEDYKLVERYLLNTHAPTHKDWSLELEEVFSLDRDGELNKYSRYKNNLHNKMLLWHGSRLTNFVGILSQGLRIAPPEAPVTGYMFGKGLYFADLVSKSAQYCYVDRDNPVGLMLLSEVALGDMYELKKATSMDKPPRGKHSTKGLGKTVPLESEFVNWRDDVVVPCGKPVPSSVRSSELLYNEYIVYNTSQVKMQFLLKVRFHHKR